jgi:hypothetical protein
MLSGAKAASTFAESTRSGASDLGAAAPIRFRGSRMGSALSSGSTVNADVWSEKRDERYADSHESAANDAPEVQAMRRHIHQAEVIDRQGDLLKSQPA